MTRRVIAFCCGLLLALTPAPGQGSRSFSAQEILRRAENVRSPDMGYGADFTLEIVDAQSSWKRRTASYSLVAAGKDRTLVLMREPQQFYPGLLLISAGRYWLLLPRSAKPFQLAPRHILNGDISNGDLARGNLLAYYEPRLDGEAEMNGRHCWRIELTRTSNMGMHKRIVGWIEKRTFRPVRFDYFGETGTRMKIAVYEDYRESEIGVRAMRIVVDNRVRPSEKTTMTFSNLRRFDPGELAFERESLPDLRERILSRQPDPRGGRPLETLLAAP